MAFPARLAGEGSAITARECAETPMRPMESNQPSIQARETRSGTPALLGGFFLLTLAALIPPLLVLFFLVMPTLENLEKGQKEITSRLERIEKITSLSYFSRDPKKATLPEILKFLRFWTEEETLCLPQEVKQCKDREMTAVKALEALGKPALEALAREALAPDEHAGAKYYRKAILDALALIDPDRAADVAEKILLGRTYSTQARIFAARKLLEVSRDRGVQALRAAVKENDHRSLDGYAVLVQTYLEETTDQARGEVIYKILHRDTLDLSTLQEILQAVPLLDRKDPYLEKICKDLVKLFFRRNLESFRAAVLFRPLSPNLTRQIIRSLAEVLPPRTLKPFLEEALKVTVEEGTRQEILKYLREKCR